MVLFGGLVLRLGDRAILSQAICAPSTSTTTDNVSMPSIPIGLWPQVVDRCTPHYRTTCTLGGFGVHIMTTQELGFAVISDMETSRRSGHYTLDEIQKLFKKMFVESVDKLNPNSCLPFNEELKLLLVKYSDEANVDSKVKKVKQVVNEAKDIALDNIDKVLQRGDKIDDIVNQTDELQSTASAFQRGSRDLHHAMWWQSVKGSVMIGGMVVVFLFVVYLIFCGGFSCHPSGKKQTT